MGTYIKNIEFFLPSKKRTNEELKKYNPEWDVERIASKTGVYSRYIAEKDETAFDLACGAVNKLFQNNIVKKDEIDGIIFCTQSPDYIMPSNSFLIHQKFNFSKDTWAFDYNLACSGYVYGLCIARGFLETGLAKNIMLITSDTYSKYINNKDRSTINLFGDGAAVTIVSTDKKKTGIIDAKLSSSGKDHKSFIIPAGGCRFPINDKSKIEFEDSSGNIKNKENIDMNGFAIWKFVSKTVPMQIMDLLNENNLKVDQIDFFALHQASKLTLDSLAKKVKIPQSKLYRNYDIYGNTVSSSIPIVLKSAIDEKKLKRNDLLILSGFGVGLSWGSILMRF